MGKIIQRLASCVQTPEDHRFPSCSKPAAFRRCFARQSYDLPPGFAEGMADRHAEPMTGSEIISRAKDAIRGNLAGPLAKDMPYTPYTDSTLQRLAALRPKSLAVMHGSSFQGNGQQAILDLAVAIRELLGTPDGS